MTTGNTKNLSEFGQAAITLDTDLLEMIQLSGQISRLDIHSESGLDKALEGLGKFQVFGERIAEGIQNLAKSLEKVRSQAEESAQTVGEIANQVQVRQVERDRILGRYRALSEMVQKVSQAMSQFKKPLGELLSEEEKTQLPSQVMDLESGLNVLIEEVQKLKEESRDSKFKSLERNADSLGQSLEAARRKLASAVGELKLH